MKDKQTEIKWSEWYKTLPLAKRIERTISPAPKSHRDFCEAINRVGIINAMLMEENDHDEHVTFKWTPIDPKE